MLGVIMSMAMSGLLSSCAPNIGSRTMTAIVQYESGWKPWSIGDNTARKSYSYRTRLEAENQAAELLKMGHDIDAGLAQVNSTNFSAYGLNIGNVFDPCINIHIGASILAHAYTGALRKNWIGKTIQTNQDIYLQQQYALIHALSAYNSGGYWASMKYAGNVYKIALEARKDFRQSNVITPQVMMMGVSEPRIHPISSRINKELPIIHRSSQKISAASIIINGTAENWNTEKQ